MTRLTAFAPLLPSAVAIGTLCASAATAEADAYKQTDLVSNIAGLATLTDPRLINPWGLSFIGPTPISGPFWIADQGTNAATLYAVTGATTVSKVDINPPSGFVGIPTISGSGPLNGPTGQVSNTGSSFMVGAGANAKPADFIFANLNGTISAWNGGPSATTERTTTGAVYTGLAMNQAQTELYAANAAAGAVDVFNGSFAPIASPFTRPTAIAADGFVPFNVEDIGSSVYVTYALPGHAAEITATAGQGAVAVFSESGVLEKTIVGGPLASPWGVVLAPAHSGDSAATCSSTISATPTASSMRSTP
jgi:uncharacterized protein (TIGR03118 family)